MNTILLLCGAGIGAFVATCLFLILINSLMRNRLFGYSDDNAEFRGAINDEVGCYNGGTLFVHQDGVLQGNHEDCRCEYCGFKTLRLACAQIEAKWDCNGYSWMYATEIPHASFDIMEGDEKYCRGIVFERSALPYPSVQERTEAHPSPGKQK